MNKTVKKIIEGAAAVGAIVLGGALLRKAFHTEPEEECGCTKVELPEALDESDESDDTDVEVEDNE